MDPPSVVRTFVVLLQSHFRVWDAMLIPKKSAILVGILASIYDVLINLHCEHLHFIKNLDCTHLKKHSGFLLQIRRRKKEKNRQLCIS